MSAPRLAFLRRDFARAMRLAWPAPVALAAVLLLAAAPAAAQPAGPLGGSWQITPLASYTRFDGTSAIRDGAGIGIGILRFLTDALAIGPNVTFNRTESDGSFFPALLWNMEGDSSRIVLVGQELSVLAASMRAELHRAFEVDDVNVRAFALAGAGGYRIYLDPQSNSGGRWFSRAAFEGGGGVDIRLGTDSGVRIEVRDLVMTGYDRERLRIVDERFESPHFVRPDVPPARETIHNISLTVGFTYYP